MTDTKPQIKLPDKWVEMNCEETGQRIFRDVQLNSQITASLEPLDVAVSELKEVLEQYIEIRLRKEAEEAFPRKLQLRTVNVQEIEDRSGYQAIYIGSDDSETYHYSCYIAALSDKMITVYCESKDSTFDINQQAFRESLEELSI